MPIEPTTAALAVGTARAVKTSIKLSSRNRDWRELKDQLGWTYSKIATHVGKSIRAVKAGVANARQKQTDDPAQGLTDDEVSELIEYAQGHPLYRQRPEVQQWIQTVTTAR